MFSLVSARLASRFTCTLKPVFATASARVVLKPSLQLPGNDFLTRRTFLTSPPVGLPKSEAAEESAGSESASPRKSTTRKSSVKKTAAEKPAVKKKPAAKKKPVVKKKPVAKKKPVPKTRVVKKPAKKPKPAKVKITKEDKPPKKPGNAFIIFFTKYLAAQPKAKNTQESYAYSQAAGKIWNNYNAAEKQPFVEEHQAHFAAFLDKRMEYFKTVDPKVLQEINRRRVAKGRRKIRLPKVPVAPEKRKPTSAFFRFIREFSQTPEGLEIAERGTVNGLTKTSLHAIRAGEIWRGMSAEAKEPYLQRYREEMKAWVDKHKQS